ncbi:MAG: HAD family phosphatase [Anaerolineales bacterium]
MSIRAIYFDLGGVIVRTEDKGPRAALAAEFGMSYEEMDAFVFRCKTAQQASTGQISEQEHWRDVARRLKRPEAEWPRLSEAFFAGDRVDRQLLAFIQSLRPALKTGVISNAWDGLRAYMRREGFLAPFDEIIISAEVGIIKPDARIYQYALEKLKVQAEEAIFVDDFAENIAAANALGMRGVHFQSAAQAMEEIRALLSADIAP